MGMVADKPQRAGAILAVLLVGAAVANINMSIANVALSSIAVDLNATQSEQNLIADAFSLALAATVLYLGAMGDRYGRRRLLLLGAALSIPASLVAAWAPSVEVLVGARLVGGVAAAMLFPTTLSIISALWRGRAKGTAIALWSGVGGSAAFLGSVVAGALLLWFWWGSVFVFTVPFALLVLVAGSLVLPSDTGLDDHPVDHLGGALSVVGVAALIFGVQEISSGVSTEMIALFVVAAICLTAFMFRQARAPHPLIDLKLAGQQTFWVAAVAGAISFGALLGALYIGQQFTANVLQYDTFQSAATTIPAAIFFLAMSPVASRWMANRGGRSTLAIGIGLMGVGFVIIMMLWSPGTDLWVVLVPYAVLGAGVAFAGAAASTAIMNSLPTQRAGMGSAFTDLTRDFGGALIQAVMAAILTVAYAGYMTTSFNALPAEEAARTGEEVAGQIADSFQTAESVAAGYPQTAADGLLQAAAEGYSTGKTQAFMLAVALVVIALVCVLVKYPRKPREDEIFARYSTGEF